MKNVKNSFIVFMLLSFGFVKAQNPEKLPAQNTNVIEDNLYEALKQKAIGNYDKAIGYMQQNIAKEPNNPVFYNQLGKNYLALKNYIQAEKSFQKAIELQPTQKWYWADLYDVYYNTKDFKKAIPTVVKLVEFDKNYQDDLVSLYMHAKEFDKALFLIESMEKESKLSVVMERYKFQILTEKNYANKVTKDYDNAVKSKSTDEKDYVALIVNHINNNKYDKAFEVIDDLSNNIPNSDWSNIPKFRSALKANNNSDAFSLLTNIVNSGVIVEMIKHRCFNEYLLFAYKNEAYQTNLETAVDYFNEQKLVNVAKEVGIFFLNKQHLALAQHYLKKGIKIDPKDVQVACLYIQTYVEQNDLIAIEERATHFLEYFPSEARLYYFLGLSQQGLNQPKKAIKSLEEALAYLIDDNQLEANIYIQLGESYNKLGNQKLKEDYFLKATKLLKN